MLQALKSAPPSVSQSEYQKNINTALQEVSKKLGNTVAVCKKYYVHPELARLYKEEILMEYFSKSESEDNKKYGLTSDEEVLMEILMDLQKGKKTLLSMEK